VLRALLALSAANAFGHAPILPPALGPFTVNGNRITGRDGAAVLLRAVEGDPAAFTPVSLGVLRLRWNLNAVRVQTDADPASVWELARRAEAHGMAVIVETASDAVRDRLKDSPNVLFAGRFPATRIAIEIGSDDAACAALPKPPAAFNEFVLERLYAASEQHVFFAGFRAGGLVKDFTEFEPTSVTRPIVCGDPQGQGIGEMVLLFTTGDSTGFGYLSPDRIASKAGGPASPLAPGQLISIYTENFGPEPGAQASPGTLPVSLGDTRVLIGGVEAPILAAGPFQIDTQVPRNLPPGERARMRILFKGIPSNLAEVDVVRAAPEIFIDTFSRIAVATNQDGRRNALGAPAGPGTVVTLYATGCGATDPAIRSGELTPSPHPALVERIEVTVDGVAAAIVFAGEVPGFAGLNQINIRLADGRPGDERTAPVRMSVAGRTNQSAAFLRIR